MRFGRLLLAVIFILVFTGALPSILPSTPSVLAESDVFTPSHYGATPVPVTFDLEELMASTAYDIEESESSPAYLGLLLKEVRELRAAMADGSYLFGREDLPFMRLVKRSSERVLPFIRLFHRINQTHKLGLDVQED